MGGASPRLVVRVADRAAILRSTFARSVSLPYVLFNSRVFCKTYFARNCLHWQGRLGIFFTKPVLQRKARQHMDVAIERVRVRILPDGRMSRASTAQYLGVAAKTLAMWQLQGKGPRSVLVGGRRFYFKDDCDAFVRGTADSVE
jgi:hypothetical protein